MFMKCRKSSTDNPDDIPLGFDSKDYPGISIPAGVDGFVRRIQMLFCVAERAQASFCDDAVVFSQACRCIGVNHKACIFNEFSDKYANSYAETMFRHRFESPIAPGALGIITNDSASIKFIKRQVAANDFDELMINVDWIPRYSREFNREYFHSIAYKHLMIMAAMYKLSKYNRRLMRELSYHIYSLAAQAELGEDVNTVTPLSSNASKLLNDMKDLLRLPQHADAIAKAEAAAKEIDAAKEAIVKQEEATDKDAAAKEAIVKQEEATDKDAAAKEAADKNAATVVEKDDTKNADE
jgi:hypothetical protein